MAKKKISTQDFMNLLDDQETATDKSAFRPTRVKRERSTDTTKKQTKAPKKGFQLSPIQKEWLRFAAGRCPEFITKAVTSDRTVQFLEKVYVSLDEALTVLHRAKSARQQDKAHSPASGASSDSSTH